MIQLSKSDKQKEFEEELDNLIIKDAKMIQNFWNFHFTIFRFLLLPKPDLTDVKIFLIDHLYDNNLRNQRMLIHVVNIYWGFINVVKKPKTMSFYNIANVVY